MAEDRLAQTQKMEALGQLAGGVAHEFNNLLTGIIGFAHMARKRPDDPERVTTCIEEIIVSAERSSDITRQLLRFSRRHEDEGVSELSVIYPHTVIKGMQKMIESLLGTAVTLSFSLAASEASCRIDASQLSQVILNLAVNARDAMPQGGTLVIGQEVVDPTLWLPLTKPPVPVFPCPMSACSCRIPAPVSIRPL
ncbi:MAG: multi-sensor hybrid histidine kinase [Rhodospirillaceae bacterium]|nr:MAG: multi-sensor hybrid histidine kinase [Rhodospirillaceae bacterium]